MTEQSRLLNLLAELATPALIAAVGWFLNDYFKQLRQELRDLKQKVEEVEQSQTKHELSTERRLARIEAAVKEGGE